MLPKEKISFLALGSLLHISRISFRISQGFSTGLYTWEGLQVKSSTGRAGSQKRPQDRQISAHLSLRAQIQEGQNHGSRKSLGPPPLCTSLYRRGNKGSGNRSLAMAPLESKSLGFLSSTLIYNSGPQIGVLIALKNSQRQRWKPYHYFLHFVKPKQLHVYLQLSHTVYLINAVGYFSINDIHEESEANN